MNIIITLLVISFIVFFHELGHFILAKLNKIKVVEFSIGFGPRLISKQIGETRYSVKVLPLGGSCEMEGMLEEMADEKLELSDRSFVNKGKLARASVIIAGPLFNFILAIFLSFTVIHLKGYNEPFISRVIDNSPAMEAGIEPGDIILSIDGKKIHNSPSVSLRMLSYRGNKPLRVKVQRDKRTMEFSILPTPDERTGRYAMGVMLSYDRVNGSIVDSFKYAYYETVFFVESTVTSFRMMITGQAKVNEMIGPVGLTSVVGQAIQDEKGGIDSNAIFNIMNLTALISANLGVMNLLPIPAFDGGRLLLVMVEAIRGKKLNPRTEERIIITGFLILIGLSVLILFNDVLRLVK